MLKFNGSTQNEESFRVSKNISGQPRVSLPRCCYLGRHATLWGGALHDDPNKGCIGVKICFKSLAFKTPFSLGISNDLPSGEYGYSLKPHIICYTVTSNKITSFLKNNIVKCPVLMTDMNFYRGLGGTTDTGVIFIYTV